MRRTRYGAQLYAIGGNPQAARLSGIDVKRVIFLNFVIAGFGYGVTGVALTARVGGAVAGSAGLFLELDAIAAAIIGGTALSGGRGRVLGALVGVSAVPEPDPDAVRRPILIAHDLAAVAYVCDRVAVMYLGQIVELGTIRQVYYAPNHPLRGALDLRPESNTCTRAAS